MFKEDQKLDFLEPMHIFNSFEKNLLNANGIYLSFENDHYIFGQGNKTFFKFNEKFIFYQLISSYFISIDSFLDIKLMTTEVDSYLSTINSKKETIIIFPFFIKLNNNNLSTILKMQIDFNIKGEKTKEEINNTFNLLSNIFFKLFSFIKRKQKMINNFQPIIF